MMPEAPHMLLRPVRPCDAEAFSAFSDPEAMPCLYFAPASSLAADATVSKNRFLRPFWFS